MEKAGLCCSWNVVAHRQLGITPRTTSADSMTLEPTSMTSLPSGIFMRLAAVPNRSSSVLIPLSCKRFDTHQPLTSTMQLFSFDIICSVEHWLVGNTIFPGCHPRTDDGPCGTPNFNVKPQIHYQQLGQSGFNQSFKKSASQSKALPHTPTRRRMTSSRIQRSTMSNVAERSSNNMSAPTWPWSMAVNMLFMTQTTAVSVELNGR